ncbi:aminotransferase class III-fold pyridoxal phosphate-dependent enzyme [Mesorhizobium sp. M7A.F.Ca.US.014.04.1.1]|uniref:aminotransferase class III-fold pyridoxal phosphate-dependent enzyme n=4 Tax=Phyllobacteriaceae TaxID=69277 RepID=UPI0009EEED30|nr:MULTISPECIES: aminotransferase class III-fold pyridoxal phosphate-dependent enzyme [Mesorhizobium]RUZ72577.1 aminotransferase class III-fold pyridoxal phosphate-dependent enzyme [Mesorhizobium sp. M7A.F.Ca.US.003.02.2.1]MDF3206776.1 aminotransferase class III-fold pyridoxal phosphate-dependent enzyme [Mesorhizobium sp. LMG15046]MDF3230342.1 aminotransferase class III-fold pyridoxal phosphate-dependent enzyme [Mesorhizobium sp. DSM 30133]RUU21489.1 aminotransferase class III-fold pyridoxal ph
MPSLINSKDQLLRERAASVIPGGMWGHMATRYLGSAYPQFFERADGCRVWDVDGHEYIDLMCSWGPNILGHHHQAVEEAAARQRRLGDAMNGPGEVLVELAELLVKTVAHADWAMLQKNGTDATTACVTIARAGTGRRKVLVARGSYHGAVPWCTPSLAGVTAEDRAHLIHFDYNDVASLEVAVEQAGNDLAAVVVTAFRHDIARDQELPTAAFAKRARELTTAADAALIVDDVRAGFRIDLAGSWEPLGVRPDLSAFSKAIANGYPLAAIAGTDRFREAATKVYVTGSFWYGAVAMAAAIATISTLRDTDAVTHMTQAGDRLRSGLDAAAKKHGLSLRQTGPVSMPMVLFDGDAEFKLANAFCSAALREGAYFHPRHNMFLSAAHTAKDIDLALQAADAGMAAAAQVA